MKKNYAARPLWFWNDLPTPNGIKEIMENCKTRDGYAGFGILPYNACKLKYMSDEYLYLYGVVLKEAKRLNLKICLYDEWWFPSGSAGGILKTKHREACAKRLDVEEFTSNSGFFKLDLSEYEKIMAVVAMKDNNRIDLKKHIKDNMLIWTAPDNEYKVLCFVLKDAELGRVDYLNPESVKKFISCTHDVYYENFSEYFGDVIDSAFYDEPQFYSARGRAWTEIFNDKFFEKYNEAPDLYYPALFYDIGEETAKARNMMFGLRAELYSKGFPKVVQEWCTAHGISLTGHVDQEEAENPCGITGDLMLSFKYQDIPGIDEIFCEERASSAYKIVSSSAVNFNKKLVMCECFGAMENVTEEGIYRESYDLLTKGINHLIPHAVWYNPENEKVKFKPELSYRNKYYGKFIKEYNKFCSIVQKELQNSFQVNSIAMLYPIENLQYIYNFSWGGDPVSGGPTSENNDYMRLGQYIIRELNYDFVFIHPEVLCDNCQINAGEIEIKNSVHYQNYHTVIIPGMSAISLKTMEKLKEFVYFGGTLISVTELPTIAVDSKENEMLGKIIVELFGISKIGNENTEHQYGKGECYALPRSNKEYIREILMSKSSDTEIKRQVQGLQYIHKRNEKSDIWYFASLKNDAHTEICVKGKYSLTANDPKSGKAIIIPSKVQGETTRFDLKLDKEQSVLIKGSPIK